MTTYKTQEEWDIIKARKLDRILFGERKGMFSFFKETKPVVKSPRGLSAALTQAGYLQTPMEDPEKVLTGVAKFGSQYLYLGYSSLCVEKVTSNCGNSAYRISQVACDGY